MDMGILEMMFSYLACPGRFRQEINIEDINSKKKGSARYLALKCSSCGFVRHFYSSKTVESDRRGMKLFDVNVRTVYGLRAIGGGFSSLRKFCGYLNMTKPLTQKNFDRLSRQIMMATINVAEKSMSDAALELRETENTDVGVSIDGTWQKRGFSSHNGVVTAISIDTGKVLDSEIMCRCCKGCTKMQSFRKTNPKHFEIWRASHKCSLNYRGSAPNMEKIGAVKIFERSIEKYSLRYTDFYGDGDSKSFSAVEKVYGDDKLVSKKECIGHYQEGW